MAGRKSSFGFASRVLLLAIVAAVIALIAVAIYAANEAPVVKRGGLGPVNQTPPGAIGAPAS